jgi:hypothetical protein
MRNEGGTHIINFVLGTSKTLPRQWDLESLEDGFWPGLARRP